ncbi:aquaporin-4 isoform X3 [Polyodon spathula]|uniref:aquaporin-4 isoform X3 n=1 Tax=Polyodon spathula TaxID=7913 RepID=UPI001B7E723A|nr:aquaporin-4 isoform X3 [Polyodon spathula]
MCRSPPTNNKRSFLAAPFFTPQPASAYLRCLSLCSRENIMVAFKGIWTQPFWRAVSGEFLATLIFVLLSLGSTINWGKKENPPPADLVLISLCFGLSIATMVQCFGHISGAHINPAVTAAMVCMKKLSLAKSLFYVVAQCLGAVAGAGILYLVTPSDVRGDFGVTMVNSKISVGHGLLVELFITFELVFTIFATCDSKRRDLKGSAALAIGFAVTIGHLFALLQRLNQLHDNCDRRCLLPQPSSLACLLLQCLHLIPRLSFNNGLALLSATAPAWPLVPAQLLTSVTGRSPSFNTTSVVTTSPSNPQHIRRICSIFSSSLQHPSRGRRYDDRTDRRLSARPAPTGI